MDNKPEPANEQEETPGREEWAASLVFKHFPGSKFVEEGLEEESG